MNINQYAGLAWYHQWQLNPKTALNDWNKFARELREKMAMREHSEVLGWMAPVRAEVEDVNGVLKAYVLRSYADELQQTSLGDMTKNLRESLDCYEVALSIFDKESNRKEWAKTQNRKGNAHQRLAEGDRTKNIEDAIECYRLSLTFFSATNFPKYWAKLQNNIGNALWDLQDGSLVNLRESIDYFKESLSFFTQENFLQEWAMTTVNMGNALQNLPAEDDTQRTSFLNQSLKCYNDVLNALDGTEVGKLRIEWARAQINKANLLVKFSGSNPNDNLLESNDCYEAASTVYNREDFPEIWATIRLNESANWAELGNFEKALSCVELSVKAFEEINHISKLAIAKGQRGEIQVLIAQQNQPSDA